MTNNAINDINVKGKPMRTARTVDRDEERREQEYDRRTNKLRGEVAVQKEYNGLLRDALIAAGIEVPELPV